MPVRWQLHLWSQLGVLGYYLAINTIIKLNTVLPIYPELYNTTFILYIFWLCTICDISIYLYDRLQRSEFHTRRRLESAYQQLKVAEAKYRSIFDNAVNGIFQSNTDGQYITANPALARIYGYPSPGAIIANFTDVGHQLYVNPQARAEFLRLITENDGVLALETQIYRHDGSIVWISEKTYAVHDQTGKLLYYEGWIEDITQRKQAEAALRVFIHAVSHDLRNPVLGNLMVLKNLLSLSGEQISLSRTVLERMWQSNDRQLNLINSLMEAHASETQGIYLQLQPVQLAQIVESAIADLQPILTADQVSLVNLVTSDLPLVHGDPTQLWRVFTNLIVNAVKHNPPELLIQIAATIKAENQSEIYCTISDNGIGISPEKTQHLFELYYRVSHLHSSVSLGLGLYLCQQIIRAHGGEIGVESTDQSGATFWLTIPLVGAWGEEMGSS
jgi:PAS domain S-box-containing protein